MNDGTGTTDATEGCGDGGLLADGPSGSYLVLTQPASDVDAQAVAAGARRYNSRVVTPQTRRSREEAAGFFDGLDLVDPGLVQPHRWRPDPDDPASARESSNWVGVARKP